MMFDLHVEKCTCCGKFMMIKDKFRLFSGLFTKTQDTQMKEKGVVYKSNSTIDGGSICVECEALGKASFTCALCGLQCSSDTLQYSVGNPAEKLCKQCYKTVSAEVWETKVDELDTAHQWDYC